MKADVYIRGYPSLEERAGGLEDLVRYDAKSAPPEWVLDRFRTLHGELVDRYGDKTPGVIFLALKPEAREPEPTYYAAIQMKPEARSSALGRVVYRMIAVFTAIEDFQAFFAKLDAASPYRQFYDCVDWEGLAHARRSEVNVQPKKSRAKPSGFSEYRASDGADPNVRTISVTATEGKHDLSQTLQLIEDEPFDPNRTVVLGLHDPLGVLADRPITWINVAFKAPPAKTVRRTSTIAKSAMSDPQYVEALDARIFCGYHEIESVMERVRQGKISRREFTAGRREQVIEALEQLQYLIRQRKEIMPHFSMDDISEKISQTQRELEEGDFAKRSLFSQAENGERGYGKRAGWDWKDYTSYVYTAVAVILTLLCAGAYFYFTRPSATSDTREEREMPNAQEAAPTKAPKKPTNGNRKGPAPKKEVPEDDSQASGLDN